MTIGIKTSIVTDMLGLILTAINAGAGAGKCRIYDGTRPATGGAATTLLAEFTLLDPAGSVSGKILTITPPSNTTAVATGTATWFRILDSDNVHVVDGSVGSDMTLSDTTLEVGQALAMISAKITGTN